MGMSVESQDISKIRKLSSKFVLWIVIKNCHQICHYEFHLGISERVSDKGTSQELRNCPIQCLNCRKCLLLVGRWIGLVRFGPEG